MYHCAPIVLELKYNLNANTAISQIKRQNYGDALKSYFGDVIMVGINYDRKTKKHSCVIELVAKSDTIKALSRRQRQVLEFCADTAHTAEEIFSYLGIQKHSKHYNVYIKALLDCGVLTDVTPKIRINKKYINSQRLVKKH